MRTYIITFYLFIFCLFLSGCNAVDDSTPVAILVEIPRPDGIDESQLKIEFEQAMPRFQSVNGLLQKYFVSSPNSFGGVYLWASRDAADKFFDQQWKERIETTYGQTPSLNRFLVPLVTAGASSRHPDSEAVVAVVKVTPPWYAPTGLVVNKMKESVDLYSKLTGLLFKYYTIAVEDGKVGGIYLWQDQHAADQFYDQAWRQRIQDSYQEAAELTFYAAQLTMVNPSDVAFRENHQ